MLVPMRTPAPPTSGMMRPSAGAGPSAAAAANNPAAVHPDGSAVNPELLMSVIKTQPMGDLPPDLAEAVRNNNVQKFQDELRKLAAMRRKAQEEEARFLRLAEEDPFNPEVQKRLEEAIQQKNVAENFEQAIEHNPEAFASVSML